jgi:hypothetical protein
MTEIFTNFGYKFFLRAIIPGFFIALFVISLFFPLGNIERTQYVLLSLYVIIGGIALLMMDPIIYQYFEGRYLAKYCPFFHKVITDCYRNRIKKIYNNAVNLKEKYGINYPKYLELRYRLRYYPIDEKEEPTATCPTVIGNILYAAEAYPMIKYGMNPVFYFYRIWLVLDKDARSEMDLSATYMDSIMYTKFILRMATFVYLILFIAIKADLLPSLSDKPFGIYLLGSFVLCHFIHWVSIPLVYAKGEYFKSMFDLYRNRLSEMGKLSSETEEKKKWIDVFKKLQSMPQ